MANIMRRKYERLHELEEKRWQREEKKEKARQERKDRKGKGMQEREDREENERLRKEQNKRERELVMLKEQLAFALLQNSTSSNAAVVSGLISSLATVSHPTTEPTNGSIDDAIVIPTK
ncbi:hypothetical protein BC939DRAFT_492433 [Gamsiella multidivaricata]|uniref:uncharacterized protein n=1 Tax=Gamsiella multidivaricata TaxID=101098 RepID=UPI00221E590F|nr:uncharacterized protein BC939DRAFT_492433 [Gamsiella multidivaricata]KAI7824817.1 hypothetical protein BC939DRAFT_492433 [Gamsiella multidivaricata]